MKPKPNAGAAFKVSGCSLKSVMLTSAARLVRRGGQGGLEKELQNGGLLLKTKTFQTDTSSPASSTTLKQSAMRLYGASKGKAGLTTQSKKATEV